MIKQTSYLFFILLIACQPKPDLISDQTQSVVTVQSTASAQMQIRQIVTRPDSVAISFLAEIHTLIAWSPQGNTIWTIILPDGERVQGLPAVAADSSLYVRTTNTLWAFTLAGEVRWKKTMPVWQDEYGFGQPTPLSNSGVLVAENENTLVAFEPNGAEMWRFTLPHNEKLNAVPKMALNGMVSLATDVAIIQLRGDGIMQWYRLFSLAQSQTPTPPAPAPAPTTTP